jgi:hypothetical protein
MAVHFRIFAIAKTDERVESRETTFAISMSLCLPVMVRDWRDADTSSERGCSRDQKQPCHDDDGAGGARDTLTARCETLDGDGRRHDSHSAKVHDPDDQEDCHQTDTAVAAVEAEA